MFTFALPLFFMSSVVCYWVLPPTWNLFVIIIIILITSLARVNPSAIADINGCPGKLYKMILK